MYNVFHRLYRDKLGIFKAKKKCSGICRQIAEIRLLCNQYNRISDLIDIGPYNPQTPPSARHDITLPPDNTLFFCYYHHNHRYLDNVRPVWKLSMLWVVWEIHRRNEKRNCRVHLRQNRFVLQPEAGPRGYPRFRQNRTPRCCLETGFGSPHCARRCGESSSGCLIGITTDMWRKGHLACSAATAQMQQQQQEDPRTTFYPFCSIAQFNSRSKTR